MANNFASAIGSVFYKCPANAAGEVDTQYVELVNVETGSGGNIRNNSITTTPAKTGIVHRVKTTTEYDSISINVPDDVTEDPYGEDTVTILNDAAASAERFDLVKMIPVLGGKYKVTVYTGFLENAGTDNVGADQLQRGEFSFSVSSRKEFEGTIVEGKPVLTART